MMKRALLCATIWIVSFATLLAQQPLWVRHNTLGDTAKAMAVQGNLIAVTGYTQTGSTGNDYTTVEYSPNGNLLWESHYHYGDDRASVLTVDHLTGEVYVSGRSANKITTVKYDTNGNQQWVRRYEHRTGGSVGIALSEDSHGNRTIFVGGTTNGDYTLIKYPGCYVPGDVDGNCCVDDADLLIVLFGFGETGIDRQADLNSDGVVDDADLLSVLFSFGNGC